MQTIVTVCNQTYRPLLLKWLSQVRKITAMPIHVIVPPDFSRKGLKDCTIIRSSPTTNPFNPSLPDHACAEKLRIFEYLPADFDQALFVDVDAIVLADFWSDYQLFEKCRTSLVACQDFFVGYKEKMEEEFGTYDPTFRMQYYPDGTFHYFNTGVFFASRDQHASVFSAIILLWDDYVKKMGRLPSIFDQNVVNYYLISRGVSVLPMPTQNNCIRQYRHYIEDHQLLLEGKPVAVYHLNGGSAELKLQRWLELEEKLEGKPCRPN